MGIASIRNLDYVVLLCEDLVRARQFYLDVMKFRIERETPTWVSFHVGSGLLCLRPRTPQGVFRDGPGAPGSASASDRKRSSSASLGQLPSGKSSSTWRRPADRKRSRSYTC